MLNDFRPVRGFRMIHHLKTWPVFFNMVTKGTKLFEIRLDDRGFEIWDLLHLMEYSEREKAYTGRTLHAEITSKISISHLVADNLPFCVMGIRPGGSLTSMERVCIQGHYYSKFPQDLPEEWDDMAGMCDICGEAHPFTEVFE